MCTKLLQDARFFKFIQTIDEDTVAAFHAKACQYCSGKLDRANFNRKPRGVPVEVGESFELRPSFCCRVDGCRKRFTPPQIRFLGRKVYASLVVVLAAAMTQGLAPQRLSDICRACGASPATIRRWLQFWKEVFVSGPSWIYHRGNLAPSVDEGQLPRSLLDHFILKCPDIEPALKAVLVIVTQCVT